MSRMNISTIWLEGEIVKTTLRHPTQLDNLVPLTCKWGNFHIAALDILHVCVREFSFNSPNFPIKGGLVAPFGTRQSTAKQSISSLPKESECKRELRERGSGVPLSVR